MMVSNALCLSHGSLFCVQRWDGEFPSIKILLSAISKCLTTTMRGRLLSATCLLRREETMIWTCCLLPVMSKREWTTVWACCLLPTAPLLSVLLHLHPHNLPLHFCANLVRQSLVCQNLCWTPGSLIKWGWWVWINRGRVGWCNVIPDIQRITSTGGHLESRLQHQFLLFGVVSKVRHHRPQCC